MSEPIVSQGQCTPEGRYPKEIVLRDREEVLLRPMEPEDFQPLCRFYGDLEPRLRWFMKEDPCEAAVVRRWIDNHKEGRAFSILALCDQRIVAHASLLLRPFGGRSHVGRLRVYVNQDFRRKQLGTWMVFDLIKYALAKGLELIRCDFVVGMDDAAIQALRKLDFVAEGLIKDYVKDEQGRPHDYQIMIKQLHRGWSDF